MMTMGTPFLSVLGPMKLLAFAHLAEIASKGANFEEPKKGKELSDTILDWSSRKAPLVSRFQGETCTCNTSCALLVDVSRVRQ